MFMLNDFLCFLFGFAECGACWRLTLIARRGPELDHSFDTYCVFICAMALRLAVTLIARRVLNLDPS